MISIWLIPATKDIQYLQKIIDNLAGTYKAPVFKPHCTLYSSSDLPASELKKILEQSAKNLTEALTYDNKIQGDWGEEILSSLLSSYGFQEGVEFDLQKQYKNEMGEKFKPDVILHLPEGKDVVIDSKVSLKDYVDYVADQTNELALKKHITSIENQIKNISIKEYENLEGVRSLDFIFVFIPVGDRLERLAVEIRLVPSTLLPVQTKTLPATLPWARSIHIASWHP